MDNKYYKRAVGLFHTRDEAEQAIHALKDANFDMDRVSIIARDADQIEGYQTHKTTEKTETEEVGNKADEGAKTGAITGGALGGLTGLLVGLGALAIPGIGPILLAGAEATALATTLAGGAIGAAAGGLVGALIGLGIPEEKAKIYSDRVKEGSFLVMVRGTTAEISRAESIMRNYNVDEFGVYDVPGAKATTVDEVDEDIRTRTDIPDHEKIRLYEERLMVDKQREKAGEVAVGKEIKTEQVSASVPVEKERIVIEHKDATQGQVVSPRQADFTDGEVARVDIYEETAEISKEAFVREEVDVRKEVNQETVEAQETVRREELNVEIEGDEEKLKREKLEKRTS